MIQRPMEQPTYPDLSPQVGVVQDSSQKTRDPREESGDCRSITRWCLYAVFCWEASWQWIGNLVVENREIWKVSRMRDRQWPLDAAPWQIGRGKEYKVRSPPCGHLATKSGKHVPFYFCEISDNFLLGNNSLSYTFSFFLQCAEELGCEKWFRQTV